MYVGGGCRGGEGRWGGGKRVTKSVGSDKNLEGGRTLQGREPGKASERIILQYNAIYKEMSQGNLLLCILT